MRRNDSIERVQRRVVDYSTATARAIEWLGDRYLLAKPINRRFVQPKDWQRSARAAVPCQVRADLP